jgi:hypothetical protein
MYLNLFDWLAWLASGWGRISYMGLEEENDIIFLAIKYLKNLK